jgi:hypothetical protein
MRNKIRIAIAFALSMTFTVTTGAVSSPANATPPIISIVDGSTLIGDVTFSITIPDTYFNVSPPSYETVYIEFVNISGNASYGFSMNFDIHTAGTYTYTLNPFADQVELRTSLQPYVSATIFNIFGNPANVLRSGSNQIYVRYRDVTDNLVSQQLTNVTFKHACAPGTFSSDGGVPLTGSLACTNSPVNHYVSLVAATSAAPCPTNYTSAAGSDSISDCVAPIVATPTVAKGKKLTGKSLATQIGISIPKKAKVTLKVAKASKKFCKVSGTSIKALKRGSCVVTVKVNPKKGKTTTKSTTIAIS